METPTLMRVSTKSSLSIIILEYGPKKYDTWYGIILCVLCVAVKIADDLDIVRKYKLHKMDS
jgi:hypothetical protein